MSRVIGVATSAVAPNNLLTSLEELRPLKHDAIELSVPSILQPREFLHVLGTLDLSPYSFVAIRVPVAWDYEHGSEVRDVLANEAIHPWPVVVSPQILIATDWWKSLESRLHIENTDKRQKGGRTVAELDAIFDRFPQASFCLNLGNARQVDPTMTEAALIIRRFGERIKQIRISEVNSLSHREGITFTAMSSFRKVAELIPTDVPVILETPVPVEQIPIQIRLAERALTPPDSGTPASHHLNGNEPTGSHPFLGDPVKM